MTNKMVEGERSWLFAPNIWAWGLLSTISMSRTSNISAIAPSMIFTCRPSRNAVGCAIRQSTWKKVEGKRTVHSYSEVHHAIQPAFRGKTPYLILLVDLDTQKGEPTAQEALRVAGNLTTPDGELAPPEMVRQVGIG